MAKAPIPLFQGTLVYSLTAAGRKQLMEQREGWARFASALGAILKTS
jgi:hypothetical protein